MATSRQRFSVTFQTLKKTNSCFTRHCFFSMFFFFLKKKNMCRMGLFDDRKADNFGGWIERENVWRMTSTFSIGDAENIGRGWEKNVDSHSRGRKGGTCVPPSFLKIKNGEKQQGGRYVFFCEDCREKWCVVGKPIGAWQFWQRPSKVPVEGKIPEREKQQTLWVYFSVWDIKIIIRVV